MNKERRASCESPVQNFSNRLQRKIDGKSGLWDKIQKPVWLKLISTIHDRFGLSSDIPTNPEITYDTKQLSNDLSQSRERVLFSGRSK